jgi:hypothetical protein
MAFPLLCKCHVTDPAFEGFKRARLLKLKDASAVREEIARIMLT